MALYYIYNNNKFTNDKIKISSSTATRSEVLEAESRLKKVELNHDRAWSFVACTSGEEEEERSTGDGRL